MFEDNFERAFGSDEEALHEISQAMDRYKCLLTNPKSGRAYLYSIAFPWASPENDRMVDYYGFDFDSDFDKCNLEHRDFVLKNGLLDPEAAGCETELIILGREGDLRRRLVEEGIPIDKYINEFVDLGNLGPVYARRLSIKF